ncbi:hypothetical protein ACFL27_18660, partial [candidate division CSSED10-310 bacterium]
MTYSFRQLTALVFLLSLFFLKPATATQNHLEKFIHIVVLDIESAQFSAAELDQIALNIEHEFQNLDIFRALKRSDLTTKVGSYSGKLTCSSQSLRQTLKKQFLI